MISEMITVEVIALDLVGVMEAAVVVVVVVVVVVAIKNFFDFVWIKLVDIVSDLMTPYRNFKTVIFINFQVTI